MVKSHLIQVHIPTVPIPLLVNF